MKVGEDSLRALFFFPAPVFTGAPWWDTGALSRGKKITHGAPRIEQVLVAKLNLTGRDGLVKQLLGRGKALQEAPKKTEGEGGTSGLSSQR